MSNIQWIFAGVIYFAPWIAAAITGHRQAAAIFVVNLFLGWTVFGWIAAVVWAVMRRDPPNLVAPGAPGFVFGDETAPREAAVKYSETVLADNTGDRAPGIQIGRAHV